MIKKWKEEWFKRKEQSFMSEFDSQLNEFESQLEKCKNQWNKKLLAYEENAQESHKNLLNSQKQVVDLIEDYDKQKQELHIKIEELKQSKTSELDTIKCDFDKKIEVLTSDYTSLENKLRSDYHDLVFKQSEIDELSKRLEERKLALARENEELKNEIKIAEAKSSPSNVWAEAFTAGFNKAWDMMFLQQEGMERVKKIIEDKAIQDTLRRMNGHNPKTH